MGVTIKTRFGHQSSGQAVCPRGLSRGLMFSWANTGSPAEVDRVIKSSTSRPAPTDEAGGRLVSPSPRFPLVSKPAPPLPSPLLLFLFSLKQSQPPTLFRTRRCHPLFVEIALYQICSVAAALYDVKSDAHYRKSRVCKIPGCVKIRE